MSDIQLNKFPQKTFDILTNTVKATAQQMISNEYNFCCTTVDLSTNINGETVWADFESAKNWMNNLLTKAVSYKPLPIQALDNMKKKGIIPKKQIGEIYLFVIASLSDYILIGIKKPDGLILDFEQFIKIFDIYESLSVSDESTLILWFDSLKNGEKISPIKTKDDISRKIYDKLRELSIYKDNNDDDELYYEPSEII